MNRLIEKFTKQAMCSKHPFRKAVDLCTVCHKPLCAKCLNQSDDLAFCNEHFTGFQQYQWSNLLEIHITEENNQLAYDLYAFQKDLWQKHKKLSYVQVSYEESEEQITSVTTLWAAEEHQVEILELLPENLLHDKSTGDEDSE